MLYVLASTSASALPSPLNASIPQPFHVQDLADLDVPISIIPLPAMEVKFNPLYHESQERREYKSGSSSDEYFDANNSDEDDLKRRGGLEHILWPSEMLQMLCKLSDLIASSIIVIWLFILYLAFSHIQ